MTVGGVQQVLLARQGDGSLADQAAPPGLRLRQDHRRQLGRLGHQRPDHRRRRPDGDPTSGAQRSTFAFSVVNGSSAFFGVLDALRQDNLAKILAEPTLVTVSGRPASFNVGRRDPVPVPQSLGTISIEYKKYGTQVDFVPIVLGNGQIRLEVRPRISELDRRHSVTIAGTTVPGLQIARGRHGRRTEGRPDAGHRRLGAEPRRGRRTAACPGSARCPTSARRSAASTRKHNEIELLILVTPELVEPMDASEVPPCGPGMQTTSPSDWELFMKGHLEVPNCCPTCDGGGLRACRNGNGADGAPPDGMIGPERDDPHAHAGRPPTARPVARSRHAAAARAAARRPTAARHGPQNRLQLRRNGRSSSAGEPLRSRQPRQ